MRGASVEAAARRAGCHITSPYHRRKVDEMFRKAWKEASDISTEALEQEAARRAYHGTTKPVFYKGTRCGGIRQYSDTLMIFLLKARKPETYRDGQEDSGKGLTLNINVVSVEDALGQQGATMDPPGLTLGQTDRGGGTGTPTDAISKIENEVTDHNRPPDSTDSN